MFRTHRLAALLLTLVAGTAISACASSRYTYRNTGYQYQQFERRAYDSGYREGLEHGRDDARRGREFSYTRHDEYRDADDGYHRGDGNKDVYRQAYRDGCRAGYTESCNQSARGGVAVPRRFPSNGPELGRTGSYGSRAAGAGYRDGFEVG